MQDTSLDDQYGAFKLVGSRESSEDGLGPSILSDKPLLDNLFCLSCDLFALDVSLYYTPIL